LVVRRLQLSADLQDAVAAYAEEWRQAFLGRDVETIPFDGRYTPDAPEEVLEVTPFVLPAVIVKAVDSPLSVEVLALDGDTPERVSALFVGSQMKHGPEVLLQAFDRRRFISTAGLSIILSRGTFRRLTEPGLTLGPDASAAFSRGALRFRSYVEARRIFDLSAWYREATDEDVRAFGKSSSLAVANVDLLLAAADTWVRKRISLVLESKVLDRYTALQVSATAKSFGVTLTIESGRLVVPADRAALKELLRVLDEDYLVSPLSDSRFLSTSKRRVQKPT
jgi:hypothetical protein